jgi:hypothetical protein
MAKSKHQVTKKPAKKAVAKPKAKPSFTKKRQDNPQKQIPGMLVADKKNPANRKKQLGDFIDMEAELLSGKTLLSVKRPVGKPCKLAQLPDFVYTRLMQYIILGCFDHVAAASVGIVKNTFYTWKARGEVSRKGIYRRFYLDLCQARGIARQIAEMNVKTKDALNWLKCGPGRSKEDEQGWTETPTMIQEGATINIQQNIDSSPERRLGVSGALAELQKIGVLQITEQGQGLLGQFAADEITEDDIYEESGNDNGNGHSSNGKAG